MPKRNCSVGGGRHDALPQSDAAEPYRRPWLGRCRELPAKAGCSAQSRSRSSSPRLARTGGTSADIDPGFAGDGEQGLKDGGVAACSPQTRERPDGRRICTQSASISRVSPRSRQLRYSSTTGRKSGSSLAARLKPGSLVDRLEFDHGFAAITAHRHGVLEKMQRSRAAPVEQLDIALLGRTAGRLPPSYSISPSRPRRDPAIR